MAWLAALPLPQGVVTCLEQEAGYILLSSLAASLPAEQLLEGVGGAEGLLCLLEPALGQEAATELDRRYCSNVVSGNCGMPRGGREHL